jgi:hypothetical protein
MVTLGFGESRRALDKSESLAEISEAVGSLNPLGLVGQRPIGRLRVIGCCLRFAQRRHAAATRRATLLGE